MDGIYLLAPMVIMLLLVASLLFQVLQERKWKRAAEERATRWEDIAERYRKQAAEWERIAKEHEAAAGSFQASSASFEAIAAQNLATANGALALLAQHRSAN